MFSLSQHSLNKAMYTLVAQLGSLCDLFFGSVELQLNRRDPQLINSAQFGSVI